MPAPNILWICSDQQRWDALGCYGNSSVRTPNIDRLADRGVLFERAYCQNPVCTPSRSSFLTGRYPRTTRCRQNGQSIPEDETPVIKLLSEAGYACGLAGKLHLSACHPQAAPVTERRIDDGYAEFHWSHGHPGQGWITHEYMHWLREKGVRYEWSPLRDSEHVRLGMPEEHHQTTWCAQKAINFMEAGADAAEPWLFSVNFFDPHHLFDPPEGYLERYLDRLDEIPLPNYKPGELDDKPIFQRIDHGGAYAGRAGFSFDEMSEEDHRTVRAAYWAMCDLVDDQVGRMLDALERTGQLENTLVIYMSDHGEMLGDHGIYLKGPYFYEPAIHVPMIVSWPGVIETSIRSNAMVELVDLAPTLLDAAELPESPAMQGRSLWPLLTGEAAPGQHRADVYCEYYNSQANYQDIAAYATTVRTERYKLVAMHGLPGGELYDLEQDPEETNNLWDESDYSDVRCMLFERLCDRMAWTVDPLPEREAFF